MTIFKGFGKVNIWSDFLFVESVLQIVWSWSCRHKELFGGIILSRAFSIQISTIFLLFFIIVFLNLRIMPSSYRMSLCLSWVLGTFHVPLQIFCYKNTQMPSRNIKNLNLLPHSFRDEYYVGCNIFILYCDFKGN